MARRVKSDDDVEEVSDTDESSQEAEEEEETAPPPPPPPGVFSQRAYKSLSDLKPILEEHAASEDAQMEIDEEAGTVTVTGKSREDAQRVASNVVAIGTGPWELVSDYMVDDETWKTVVRRKE